MERRASAPPLGGAIREFTYYFRALAGSLGEDGGWFAVLARRDPGSVRAYLDGVDLPPWDVVLAVLHDVAAQRSAQVSPDETARARRLHRAAAAEQDAALDAEAELRSRLDDMQRQRQYAVLREREAAHSIRLGSHDPGRKERLVNAYAWARDDRERAAARCQELQARLDAVIQRRKTAQGSRPRPPYGRVPAPRSPERTAAAAVGAGPGPSALDDIFAAPPQADPSDERRPGSGRPARGKQGRARYGGARFAGAPESVVEASVPVPGVSAAAPTEQSGSARPAAAKPGGTRYGGARFAGAPESQVEATLPVAEPLTGVADGESAALRGARFAGGAGTEEAVRRAAAERAATEERERREALVAQARVLVERLDQARAAGASGEVYILVSEAAAGAAERLALVAGLLERAGHHADVATLLWEAAAQPPRQMAAAAAALSEAGRDADCRSLLNQAAARSAPEVAATAAVLCAEGLRSVAITLLASMLKARTLEDAVQVARERDDLIGVLLDAGGAISANRRGDVAAALRRAGLPDTAD